MGKAEKKFEQTFGYDPKIIEPRLSQQRMWKMIAHEKSKKPLNQCIPSPNTQICTYAIAENHSKETLPYVIFERTLEGGKKELALLLGNFGNDPTKILPYLDEKVWCPAE